MKGRAAQQAVINRQRAVKIALAPLRSFLKKVCQGLQLSPAEVTVCFVTDAEITRLNENFRRKRGPTDVLSFPSRRQPRGKHGKMSPRQTPLYLGDIAISPATARRNAAKYERTLPAELRILMLHGVLHLLGYDHETDHGQMTRLETKLRRRFGLA
ncbi:MAG TPA: rRNA maturation RNase YbeY [Candidatus Dormibacteraeota bacterium]|nr:rRNA maturation RNase YbeY [Candidatus Dormibacteraeota bacterium]